MEQPPRLPRGIFFEATRNRYRVRLYYGSCVIWRSYHDNVTAALAALQQARAHRRSHVRRRPPPTPPLPPQTVLDLLS